MLNQKLTTALIVAWIIFGATSTTLAAVNTFSDVPLGHWAFQSVTALASKGIINGYGNGTFRGDRNITRYEAATMIAKFLKPKGNIINNDTTNDELPFSDVQKNHWAKNAVIVLATKGIINGYGDGTFRGNKNITRYEASEMIAKTISARS